MHPFWSVFVACVLMAAVSAAAGSASPRWRMTELVTPHGWTDCYARLINGRDQIVGYCVVTDAGGNTSADHVFLWSNGRATDLGEFIPLEMNERGQAIGVLDRAVPWGNTDKTVARYAFFWNGNRLINISTPGVAFTGVVAINDRGQIVGTNETKNQQTTGFLWQNGRRTSLDFIPVLINDRGQVVGTRATATGATRVLLWQAGRIRVRGTIGAASRITVFNHYGAGAGSTAVTADKHVQGTHEHGFFWKTGKMTDLGLFVPASLFGPVTQGINDSGQILGSIESTTGGLSIPAVWENGRTVKLGTLGGLTNPYAINNAGQIVGASAVKPHGWLYHAFVWENGKMIDLGTLGGTQSEARAINVHGQIVGSSTTTSGRWHAVTWTKQQ